MEFYMTTLRQYITPIVPTVAILLSFHIYGYIQALSKQYILSVNQNYSIVVTSTKELSKSKVANVVDNLDTMGKIDTNGSIEQFREILSDKHFSNLAFSIPFFYELKLKIFPTKDELGQIKQDLEKNKEIIKVDTFLKKHSSFATLLVNTRAIVTFFSIIVVILSLMLGLKLIEVWHYEHQERMNIMKLFGASLFERSAVLFKVAVLNAVISTFIVMLFLFYLYNNPTLSAFLADVGFSSMRFDVVQSVIHSLSISIGISFVLLFFVIIRQK